MHFKIIITNIIEHEKAHPSHCSSFAFLGILLKIIAIYSGSRHHYYLFRRYKPDYRYTSDGVTYKSEDEFYATVDASGLVKGEKVGETNIVVSSDNGVKRIPIEVMPKYTLYPDLDQYIGASQSVISSNFGSTYKQSTASSGNIMWTYVSYNSYASLIFSFKDGKVDAALAAVSTLNTTMLTKSLIERYAVAGTQNDYYFFLNHDKDVIVALNVYSASLLAVTYMPYTSTKSSDVIPSVSDELFSIIVGE